MLTKRSPNFSGRIYELKSRRDRKSLINMDEIVRKIVALGLPGVVLIVTMATTGLTGAAAITAALAMLGPGGMLGGILFLGVIGLASDSLSKYGLSEILKAVYLERYKNGENLQKLISEVNSLWVSEDLKRELNDVLVS